MARVSNEGERAPVSTTEALMLTIRGTFNVFGFQTREYDLTPPLGVATIALVIFLLIKTGV